MRIFFAIYDDSSKSVPFRLYGNSKFIVYRTANMGLVEELSNLGFEPTAMLLEEDIEAVQNGSYTNSDLTQEDLDSLIGTVDHWKLGLMS